MNPNTSAHEESWLLLPWLANGRLAGAQRALVEEHLRECAACAAEVELQRRMCGLLTEPERVTYAPGPSLRKLMERIDGEAAAAPRSEPFTARPRAGRGLLTAAWRPPGFAWAATFVLTVGLGSLVATAYRWSQPLYATYTAKQPARESLQVVFQRSLTVGEVQELLLAAGAHVVEGPDERGVFAVVPVSGAAVEAGAVSPQMRALAARLRADARVVWIEPVGPAPGALQPAH